MSELLICALLATVVVGVIHKLQDWWFAADFMVVTSTASQMIKALPRVADDLKEAPGITRRDIAMWISPVFMFSRVKMWLNRRNPDTNPELSVSAGQEEGMQVILYIPMKSLSTDFVCAPEHAQALGIIVAAYLSSISKTKTYHYSGTSYQEKEDRVAWEFEQRV